MKQKTTRMRFTVEFDCGDDEAEELAAKFMRIRKASEPSSLDGVRYRYVAVAPEPPLEERLAMIGPRPGYLGANRRRQPTP